MTEIRTTAQRLRRAIAIGRELGQIDRDWRLHALSRAGWDAACRALAGMGSETDLAAGWIKLQAYPNLAREAGIRVRLWLDNRIDRPGVYRFRDGDRWPSVYAEVLKAGLGDEQISAFVCWKVGEEREPESFGELSDWSDLETMTGPRLDELAVLDRELRATVKLCDVEWTGSVPALRVAGLLLPIGPGSVSRLASDLAEVAMRQPVTMQEEEQAEQAA